jgi:hypothetical protein
VPNASYWGAFDVCEALVADTPRRVVAILAERYFDPEQDGSPDAELSPYAVEAEFDTLFIDAVKAAQEHFGRAGLVDLNTFTFDDEIHNFDTTRIVGWVEGDRLLMIHYAIQYGDGDMQLLLTACAVPV